MEDQELGCTSRSECLNYPDKCNECSAHYTLEFADEIIEEEDEE